MAAATTSLLPADDPDVLLRIIGNTPLIPLVRVGAGFRHARVFAKVEWFNPGGSVKHRPAYRMIRAAELSGEMTPDKTTLDATRRSRVQIPSSPPSGRAIAQSRRLPFVLAVLCCQWAQ
jgi:hypothetical protein